MRASIVPPHRIRTILRVPEEFSCKARKCTVWQARTAHANFKAMVY